VIRNILFDLDGTLVDSAGDITEALMFAFATLDRNRTVTIRKEFIGPPLREIIHLVDPDLSEEMVAKVVTEFRQYYDNSRHGNTFLKEGVEHALLTLRNRNKRIFLVTNKPSIPTRAILRNFGMDFFCDVVTPDSGEDAALTKSEMIRLLMDRWHIRETESLMVGDTASDAYAARDHGIPSAILLNGYGDKPGIITSKPEYILDRIESLVGIVA
jgi:phosphoglycolate phosphatase